VLEALRRYSTTPLDDLPPNASVLRLRTVEWMMEHCDMVIGDEKGGGSTLKDFATAEGQSWPEYIWRMAQPATWGDAVTLFAMACMLGVDIRVIPTPSVSPDDFYNSAAHAAPINGVLWIANRDQVHFQWISIEAPVTVHTH
jgi:hypothetical protein